MLVLALASPNFLDTNLGDGLLIALAFVRQQELYPPVEVVLPKPFSLYSFTVTRPKDNPQDNPQDNTKESLQDSPQDK